jgi:hypothetical protein
MDQSQQCYLNSQWVSGRAEASAERPLAPLRPSTTRERAEVAG